MPRVGDPLSRADAARIGHLLRVAGLVGATECLFSVVEEPVTVAFHPVNATARDTAGDTFAKADQWCPVTLLHAQQLAEEFFIDLDRVAACAQVLRAARVAATRRAVPCGGGLRQPSQIFRVPGDDVSSKGNAAITASIAVNMVRSDPHCTVAPDCVLEKLLCYANSLAPRDVTGHSSNRDAVNAGGTTGGTPPTRRVTDAAATGECRLLVFTHHLVFALPYPKWVAEEAFFAAYHQQHSAAGGGGAFDRSSPRSIRRRVPGEGNVAAVFDLGGTHQSFADDDDDVVENSPPPSLTPRVAQLARLAVDTLVRAQQSASLTGRLNPFRDASFSSEWDDRRFLVRVIPLHHVRATLPLPHRWYTMRATAEHRSLVAAMVSALQQSSEKAATTTEEAGLVALSSGFVITRGDRSVSSADGGTTTGGRTISVRVLASHDIAVLWDGVLVAASEPGAIVNFVLRSLWGTLDHPLMAYVDREEKHREVAFRQRCLEAFEWAAKQRRCVQAAGGFGSPQEEEEGCTDIDPELLEALRAKEIILVDAEAPPFVEALRLDDPVSLLESSCRRCDASGDVYRVSQDLVHVARFPGELSTLATLVGIRTMLNPREQVSSVLPVQALAAGAARRADIPEHVEGTVCAHHYTVETLPIRIAPPSAEVCSRLSPDQIASAMVDTEPRYAVAIEHALLVYTANLLIVFERRLRSRNLFSDSNYRLDAVQSVRVDSGRRQCLSMSSILSIMISEPLRADPTDASSTVVKVDVVYSPLPIVTAAGTAMDLEFINLARSATKFEVHRFSIAGARAPAEANELRGAWLQHVGAVAYCGAEVALDDIRAAAESFANVAIGPPIARDDRLKRLEIYRSVAVDWCNYYVDLVKYRSRRQQSTAGSVLDEEPRPPPARLSLDLMSAFVSRRSLGSALGVIIACPAMADTVFCQAVLTWQQCSYSLGPDPATWQLLPLIGWLRYVHILLSGSPRERTALLLRGLTYTARPTEHSGSVHYGQLVTLLTGIAEDPLSVAKQVWDSLPTDSQQQLASISDVEAALDATPPSVLATVLSQLGLISASLRRPWVIPSRWRDANFLRNELWRPSVHAMWALSIVAAAAAEDPSPSRTDSTPADRVAVRPEWRVAMPWLPADQTSIPKKSSRPVTSEKLYQHQRLFSLTSGVVSNELWAPTLVHPPRDLMPAVVEICPALCRELRERVGVTLDQIKDSLGLPMLRAALLGGTFAGLRRIPVPYSHTTVLSQQAAPTSTVFTSADGQFLLHFFTPTAFHKLLTTMAKYHAHLNDNGTASLLPRYLGMYAIFTENAGAEGGDIVFFAVTVSPFRLVASRLVSLERADLGVSLAMHVTGSAHRVPWDSYTFDVPQDARAAALKVLHRDGAFLAHTCGFTGYACAVYFFRAENFRDEADGPRTWCPPVAAVDGGRALERRRMILNAFGFSEASSSTIPRTSIYNENSQAADETRGFARNATEFEVRPLLRWTAGAVTTPDNATVYSVNYNTAGHEKSGDARPIKLRGTVAVELTPPTTWICSICGTNNIRSRNAAIAKPCRVCFGLNERVGDVVIPVATDASEYAKLIVRANDRLRYPDLQPRTGAVNAFGIAPGASVLGPSERHMHDRAKGLVDAEDDDNASVAYIQQPRLPADSPFKSTGDSRPDAFERLSKLDGTAHEGLSMQRLSARFLQRFEAPGTMCVPAAVQGRPDVDGFLLLCIVDTLGSPLTPDAEQPDETDRYLRRFQGNIMDALGDDFL